MLQEMYRNRTTEAESSPTVAVTWNDLMDVLEPNKHRLGGARICGASAGSNGAACEGDSVGGDGDDRNEKHEKHEWCHEASALIHLGLSRIDQLHYLTLSQGELSTRFPPPESFPFSLDHTPSTRPGQSWGSSFGQCRSG